MISHCTCYCWKGPGHLRDGAGVSAILFVCSFADPFPSLFASVKFTVFKLCFACVQTNLLVYYSLSVFNFYLTRLFQKFNLFLCLFVGSDPDPSLFWCNNETAVSGVSLESCKNNTWIAIIITGITCGIACGISITRKKR